MSGDSSPRRVAVGSSDRGLRWPNKGPAETLDFAIDWTARLAGDEIAESEFVVPAGIAATASTRAATATTVWLSSGVDGQAYLIVNQVKTKAGRIMRQAVRIKVRAKSR